MTTWEGISAHTCSFFILGLHGSHRGFYAKVTLSVLQSLNKPNLSQEQWGDEAIMSRFKEVVLKHFNEERWWFKAFYTDAEASMIKVITSIDPIDPYLLNLTISAFPIVMQNELIHGKSSEARGYMTRREIIQANRFMKSVDHKAIATMIASLKPFATKSNDGSKARNSETAQRNGAGKQRRTLYKAGSRDGSKAQVELALPGKYLAPGSLNP